MEEGSRRKLKASVDYAETVLKEKRKEERTLLSPKIPKATEPKPQILNFKDLVCTTIINIKHKPVSGQINLTPYITGLFNSVTIIWYMSDFEPKVGKHAER